jgi:enamine deaminase RidA (YjgF/YER057c/UK114 family)
MAGFSRASRQGSRVHVSGTTATHGSLAIGGSDPAAQTHFAIDKIEGALRSLGARLEDVVRTRVFVRRLDDWEAVARAHGERFGHIQPANTLVSAGLVGDEYLVEVEAEGGRFQLMRENRMRERSDMLKRMRLLPLACCSAGPSRPRMPPRSCGSSCLSRHRSGRRRPTGAST